MNRRLFRSIDEACGRFAPCALSIGNFDGVHVAHRALIDVTVKQATQNRLTPSALTFDPHPAAVVAPERKPELICTLGQRIQLLFEAGAGQVFVLPFTPDVARMSPREFVSQILVNCLQTKVVVVGESFLFGRGQAGNAEVLRALGAEFGFESQFLKPVAVRGEIVSSSAIRRHISRGNVSRAGRLLGRCFSVAGPVVSGHGIGSKQTVPTLNIHPIAGQVLPRGVFVTETIDQNTSRRWPSITNVGIRPTFGGDELTIETYLLSPLQQDSPAHIQIQFRRFIRSEQRFSGAQDLRSQILKDISRAQAYWRRVSKLLQPTASLY